VTSILNITPPNGEPRASVIPAAAAEAIIAFFEALELFIFEKSFIFRSLLQTIAEMCTNGPTFPLEAPFYF